MISFSQQHVRWPTGVKLAAALFAVGFLILVSPVMSKESYDGKVVAVGDDGNEVCGFTIVEAFKYLSEVDSSPSYFQIDCTRKARDRLGFGVLFLLLSVPPAFISVHQGRTLVPDNEQSSSSGDRAEHLSE